MYCLEINLSIFFVLLCTTLYTYRNFCKSSAILRYNIVLQELLREFYFFCTMRCRGGIRKPTGTGPAGEGGYRCRSVEARLGFGRNYLGNYLLVVLVVAHDYFIAEAHLCA